MKKEHILILVVLAVLLIFMSRSLRSDYPEAHLQVGPEILEVKVAQRSGELKRGLSGVRELAENEGMLFILPNDAKPVFHMKGVLIPLGVAFIDEGGKILGLESMDPKNPSRLYMAPQGTRYALEVREGWFAKRHVKVGDTIERKRDESS